MRRAACRNRTDDLLITRLRTLLPAPPQQPSHLQKRTYHERIRRPRPSSNRNRTAPRGSPRSPPVAGVRAMGQPAVTNALRPPTSAHADDGSCSDRAKAPVRDRGVLPSKASGHPKQQDCLSDHFSLVNSGCWALTTCVSPTGLGGFSSSTRTLRTRGRSTGSWSVGVGGNHAWVTAVQFSRREPGSGVVQRGRCAWRWCAGGLPSK